MANTVTPTVDSEGNVTGFDVQSHHEGYHRGNENDFKEFSDGSIHHIFENVEVNEEAAQQLSNDEEYFAALQEVNPDASAAIQWVASGGLPKEWAQEFNEAVDGGDYYKVNEMLTTMVGLYQQSQDHQESPVNEDAEEQPEDYEDDPLADISDEDLNAELETLLSLEPQGQEASYGYEEAAGQWYEAGHSVEAGILQVTSAFHRGDVSAEEAINQVIEAFGEQAAVRAYLNLQNSLN